MEDNGLLKQVLCRELHNAPRPTGYPELPFPNVLKRDPFVPCAPLFLLKFAQLASRLGLESLQPFIDFLACLVPK